MPHLLAPISTRAGEMREKENKKEKALLENGVRDSAKKGVGKKDRRRERGERKPDTNHQNPPNAMSAGEYTHT